MTTKEKLDLLWKYLLLAVLAYGFSQLGSPGHSESFRHGYFNGSSHGAVWKSKDDCDYEDMNIDVDVKKLADGDSTIQITINGETMNINELEDLDDVDGKVFIKKMKRHGDGERKVKIVKKKIAKDK